MAATAASTGEQISTRQRAQSLWSIVHSPAVVAALLSGVIALAGGMAGLMRDRTSQSHEKVLEVRTTLTDDMSKSFTAAVGAGQRVASGLIYEPTGDRYKNAAAFQAAYNAGLGRWQVDGGRIAAELSAHYSGGIVAEWKRYQLAVTRFYRLSAALPGDERRFLVRDIWSYFNLVKRTIPWAAAAIPMQVDWRGLDQTWRFRKSARYRRAYDAVGNAFLSLGDAFVSQVLKLHPEV
jgi:hypothetical protein